MERFSLDHGLRLLESGLREPDPNIIDQALRYFTEAEAYYSQTENQDAQILAGIHALRCKLYQHKFHYIRDSHILKRNIAELESVWEDSSRLQNAEMWAFYRDLNCEYFIHLATTPSQFISARDSLQQALEINSQLYLHCTRSLYPQQWIGLKVRHAEILSQLGDESGAISHLLEGLKVSAIDRHNYLFLLASVRLISHQLNQSLHQKNKSLFEDARSRFLNLELSKLRLNSYLEATEILSDLSNVCLSFFQTTEEAEYLSVGIKELTRLLESRALNSGSSERLRLCCEAERNFLEIVLAGNRADLDALDRLIAQNERKSSACTYAISSYELFKFQLGLCLAQIAKSSSLEDDAAHLITATTIFADLEQFPPYRNSTRTMDYVRGFLESRKANSNKYFKRGDIESVVLRSNQIRADKEGIDLDQKLSVLESGLAKFADFMNRGHEVEAEEFRKTFSKKIEDDLHAVFDEQVRKATAELDEDNLRSVKNLESLRGLREFSQHLISKVSAGSTDSEPEDLVTVAFSEDAVELYNRLNERAEDSSGSDVDVDIFDGLDVPDDLKRIVHSIEFLAKSDFQAPQNPLTPLIGNPYEKLQFHKEMSVRLANEGRLKDANTHNEYAIEQLLPLLKEAKNTGPPHRLPILESEMGTLYSRKGYLLSKGQCSDIGLRYLNNSARALERDDLLHYWISNRRIALSSTLNKIYRISEEITPQNIVDLCDQFNARVSFESHPTEWLEFHFEVSHFFDYYISHLNIVTDTGADLVRYMYASVFDCLKNTRMLIAATTSLARQNYLIQRITEFADVLPFILLKLGDTQTALQVYDLGRTIRLSLAFLEDNLPEETRQIARTARRDWESNIAALESATVEILNSQFSAELANTDHLHALQKHVRANHDTYANAVAGSHLYDDDKFEFETLVSCIPKNAILCVSVIARGGSNLLVLARDADNKPVTELIALDGLNSQNLHDTVTGTDADSGWLKTYERFRKAQGGSTREDENVLQNLWSECNERLTEIGEGIGNKIAQPLYDRLNARGCWGNFEEIMFVPNGPLSMLPIQSFKFLSTNEPGRYRTLLQDKAVSIWPSLGAVQKFCGETRARHKDDAKVLLVNGIPDRPLNAPRFITDNEAILGVTIDGSANDADARTLAKHLEEHPVAYIYSHGYWDNENPQLSGLAVNATEKLTVQDVRKLDMRESRLCFLGACETSMIGLENSPSEFVGLPAAFMEAGLPSIVCSLWAVYDDFSQLIAGKFFEIYLGSDVSPAQALRQAILCYVDLDDEGGEWNEMMFWAPFVVYGR